MSAGNPSYGKLQAVSYTESQPQHSHDTLLNSQCCWSFYSNFIRIIHHFNVFFHVSKPAADGTLCFHLIIRRTRHSVHHPETSEMGWSEHELGFESQPLNPESRAPNHSSPPPKVFPTQASCGKGFLFQPTFSADSLTEFLQPPCATKWITTYVHVKNPKHWQQHHCVDT